MTSLTFSEGQIVDVEITALTSQGPGVGRIDGLVVFVEYSCPGDLLRVQLTKVKKNFAEGKILEVLRAGDSRREAVCPVFTRCGGCDWQHVKYPAQLVAKKKIITDALTKIAKLSTWPEFTVTASPEEFHYRNRIQIHTDEGKVGFHARKSRQLVATESCAIARPELSDYLKQVNSPANARLELRLVEGEIQVLPSEVTLGFRQVNDKQNKNLIDQVLQLIDGSRASKVFDLYCGHGNFSLEISKKFPELTVIGSDLNQPAIEAAKNLALHEQLDHLNFFNEDSQQTLSRHRAELQNSLVLIDPPRQGCSEELIDLLRDQKVANIIYISCDPATFSRDFSRLNSNDEWVISSLAAFDMFPQTAHVELVALLQSKK